MALATLIEHDGLEVTTLNFAVTAWSELIVIAHVLVPEQPAPDQPANLEPAAGLAVNVTMVPLA